MPNNISRKHHYLPEFYLKGFLNEGNRLHVLDKNSGTILNDRSPSQVFFEWNRNLFEVNGADDDYVEKLYGRMDSDLAQAYNKVRHHSPGETKLEDLIPIIFFVGLTFWRIPRTDEEIKAMMQNASPENLYFGVYENDERLPDDHEIYQRIFGRKDFIQGYRMMKPIIDYLGSLGSQSIDDWKLYYAAPDVQLHLIGDNPIISRSDQVDNIFETELIFPLTKGKTLYHTRGRTIKELKPEHRVSVDVLLFVQSERYVAGPDRGYLECIAQLATGYDTNEKIASLRQEVFDIFEE